MRFPVHALPRAAKVRGKKGGGNVRAGRREEIRWVLKGGRVMSRMVAASQAVSLATQC